MTRALAYALGLATILLGIYGGGGGGAADPEVFIGYFGSDMDTAGRYFGGPVEDFFDSAGDEYGLVAPFSGTITSFRWNSASADATTDWSLEIDGAGTTVELTGASGQVALSLAVTAGEKINLKSSAGTLAEDTEAVAVIEAD